jgi:hypothetical protein
MLRRRACTVYTNVQYRTHPPPAEIRDPMQIAIGNIKACCSRCDCNEFEPLATSEPQASDLFACERCKAQWTRGELLLRIGDEAVQRAKQFRETLEESRAVKERATRAEWPPA